MKKQVNEDEESAAKKLGEITSESPGRRAGPRGRGSAGLQVRANGGRPRDLELHGRERRLQRRQQRGGRGLPQRDGDLG